ncbi:hypothetical protein GCM10009802_03980 [Streptomyces synnematoformans]|uniref:Uncharacterized protein n=2 Tax=Streptomyces synnematoformans TaxID=415721 RepID=A0ABN2XAL9_9ACTN
MEINCVCWHSTEGMSLPSYGGGSSAPNLTVKPDFAAKKMRWYQHFRIDTSSRALRNLGGGVETNTANVVQIEVVGTCDSRHASSWRLGSRTYRAGRDYLYMGDLPAWAVRDLADFARWLHREHRVPLTSGVTFKPYPASYGANGVRMSHAKWRRFYGHCGHMHVPENLHGDPGAFPMAPILARAAGSTPQEDDVPEIVGRTDDGKKTRTPGEWRTLSIDGPTLVPKGSQAYSVRVSVALEAPVDGTLQGRYVHERPDGSRWKDSITERLTTAGSTFADFFGVGGLHDDETVTFELCYYPADSSDTEPARIKRSRVRGLYWKA